MDRCVSSFCRYRHYVKPVFILRLIWKRFCWIHGYTISLLRCHNWRYNFHIDKENGSRSSLCFITLCMVPFKLDTLPNLYLHLKINFRSLLLWVQLVWYRNDYFYWGHLSLEHDICNSCLLIWEGWTCIPNFLLAIIDNSTIGCINFKYKFVLELVIRWSHHSF